MRCASPVACRSHDRSWRCGLHAPVVRVASMSTRRPLESSFAGTFWARPLLKTASAPALPQNWRAGLTVTVSCALSQALPEANDATGMPRKADSLTCSAGRSPFRINAYAPSPAAQPGRRDSTLRNAGGGGRRREEEWRRSSRTAFSLGLAANGEREWQVASSFIGLLFCRRGSDAVVAIA